MEDHAHRLRRRIGTSVVITIGIILILTAFPVANAFSQDNSASPVQTAPATQQSNVYGWGLIAAAIAFGFGALGAGIAIGSVGAAAMGAVAEKPEIAGQALIFVALAEGLVVFGFITALIILGRLG